MGSAHFCRREQSRFNSEAHFEKLVSDFFEPNADEAGDVLEEAEVGVDFPDEPDKMGPEVPGIFLAELASGTTEGLAWEAPNDRLNDSTPRLAIEGSQIRPNRRLVKESLFHARSQNFAGIGFVLHVAYDSSSRERHSEAEIESAGSGAQGQSVDGTCIHIGIPQRLRLIIHGKINTN